ncbi:PepSY domain-containing protein [Acidovorax sp. SUPP950]|nr:PepSY domain-containing protein [Acidovorax sp. SUPP950]
MSTMRTPRQQRLRQWTWAHKWSSLVCTVFVLLMCLTGLPLIFYHELSGLLGLGIHPPPVAQGSPKADLDRVIGAARERQPGMVVQFLARELDDDTFWYVTMGSAPHATQGRKSVAVDAHTAQVLAEPRFTEGFLWLMYKLHTDFYLGLTGKLFLGFMGILLLVALVSGVVLYAPVMRGRDFGTVRQERSSRIQWLDLHNLLGIVTVTWALVVGATGVVNTWADLLIKLYQRDELAHATARHAHERAVPNHQLGSLQSAVKHAQGAVPGMTLAFVAFPGTDFTSPHHYGVFLRGDEPLTSRLVKPVLVDASTTEVTDSPDLPWYLTALALSQPLHFGDYGGLPLKVLWALLDCITIVVLGSGLFL